MDINSTSSQIGRFFLVIRPFSWRRFVLVADILLLRFWNRTGKIPVLILNEISIPAQYWQQQAPARVFDKSNQHWFWVWDHRLRVFGKTRIKELPIPGIWKNQNQRATTSSGYFKTLKELPGFKKEPEGFWVVIWPFQDFGNRGYISERGICFLGVWEPWLRTSRAALIPGGCFGAVSSVRPTLGTTIVSTTSKGGAQQVRGRQDGEMEFFLVDDGCMRCMWVQEIQNATRVERRIQRSWRRP